MLSLTFLVQLKTFWWSKVIRMKRLEFSRLIAVASLVLVSGLSIELCAAEELRYKPVNPNFGGHPLNGNQLLANATAQRQFDPPSRDRPSALESFSESIQRTILNKVAQQVTDQILGEDARDSGSFSIGEMNINFQREGDEVLIDVNDGSGGETSIKIPAPVF